MLHRLNSKTKSVEINSLTASVIARDLQERSGSFNSLVIHADNIVPSDTSSSYSDFLSYLSTDHGLTRVAICGGSLISNVVGQFIQAIVRNSNIQEVEFQNTAILSSLLSLLLSNTTRTSPNTNTINDNQLILKKLELRSCTIIEGTMHVRFRDVTDAFERNCSLESLVLHRLGESTLHFILQSLKNHPTLRHLDVSSSAISTNNIFPITNDIGEILKSPTCIIEHLELWQFHFHAGITPFDPIATGIHTCCSLRHLSLEGCHFDYYSTPLFENIFKNCNNSTVQLLDIDSDVKFFAKPKLSVLTTILEHKNCTLTEVRADGIGHARWLPGVKGFRGFLRAIEYRETLMQENVNSLCLASLSLGYIGSGHDDDNQHEPIIEYLLESLPRIVKLKNLSFMFDDNDDKYVDEVKKKLFIGLKRNSSLLDIDIDLPFWDDADEERIQRYCIRNKRIPELVESPSGLSSYIYPKLFERALDYDTMGPSYVFRLMLRIEPTM